MAKMKTLVTICAVAALLPFVLALSPVRGEHASNDFCTVEQVDPDTLWRMDTDPPSCKAVLAQSRTLGQDLRYAHVDGHVYWMKEHENEHTIELIEIEGPVAFDRLHPYLSGAYVSDGSALLYGWRRVHTLDLPINPGNLRRFHKSGPELSRYVTDGRWVVYEDRALDGADAASFRLIAPPPKKEKLGPEFGRDKSGVYYGAVRILGADPASFQLVSLPDAGGLRIQGYYAIDRAHVWDLFEGIQLVTPDYAEGIRQRLREPRPATTEPWEIPLPLKALGCGLLMLGTGILVRRVQARISSRYQASLLSRAVGVLSVAYLVLPTMGYALFFSRCSRPDDIVVWSLLGGGLAGGAILLSVANGAFMDRADAAASTAVQLAMVAVVLAIGTVLPLFLDPPIFNDVSRPCPTQPPRWDATD
jgi:hypothetical protein